MVVTWAPGRHFLGPKFACDHAPLIRFARRPLLGGDLLAPCKRFSNFPGSSYNNSKAKSRSYLQKVPPSRIDHRIYSSPTTDIVNTIWVRDIVALLCCQAGHNSATCIGLAEHGLSPSSAAPVCEAVQVDASANASATAFGAEPASFA